VPALTSASVTVTDPDVPLIGVGPEADRVQSSGAAGAPVVPLSTSLTRVRRPGWSSFVNTHTASSPPLSVIVVVSRGARFSTVHTIDTGG
jgi:hypothetical protein